MALLIEHRTHSPSSNPRRVMDQFIHSTLLQFGQLCINDYLITDCGGYFYTNTPRVLVKAWLNIFPRSRNDIQLNMSARQ